MHDLSMYGEVEARAMLRKSTGRLCVAYRVDSQGEVQFRRTALDRLGVALASAALLASAGCSRSVETESQEPDVEQAMEVVNPSCESEPKPPASTSVVDTAKFELPIVDPEQSADEESELMFGWSDDPEDVARMMELVREENERERKENERRLELERKALPVQTPSQ